MLSNSLCDVDDGIRGLPRVIEIDNALLRSVMKHYTHNMGLSVCVMVSTMQHSAHTPYSAYYDDLADEPYFTVILLKTKGGSSIRRSWKEANRKYNTAEMRIGSAALQVFMEVKDMQGKSTVDSGRLMEINSQSMGEHSADLGRVIVKLGTINLEKVEILVKSGRGKHLWYGLMKKTTGSEDRYDAGDISIKERNIPRPRDRPGSRQRGLDSGNLDPEEPPAKTEAPKEKVGSNTAWQGKEMQVSNRGRGHNHTPNTDHSRQGSSFEHQRADPLGY